MPVAVYLSVSRADDVIQKTIEAIEERMAAIEYRFDERMLVADRRLAIAENNKPEAISGEKPSLRAVARDLTFHDPSGFFHDSDGDALTLSATSAAPDVFRVVDVQPNLLVLEGLIAGGSGTLSLVATDPGGKSAILLIEVWVKEMDP